MATLKQPQLGLTIVSLRQDQKITQEELVERCHVSVRTLQRIEAGEVTPREGTLRIILEALGQDYKQVANTIEHKASVASLKMAWIFGIIYFVSGVAEAFLDYYRFEFDLPIYFTLLYTGVKILILTSYAFFMLGFVEMGKRYSRSLLSISAYLMMGSMAIIEFYDIVSIFSSITAEDFFFIKGIEAVTFGGIDVIFGIALFKLASKLGDVVRIAGLFEIIAGIFFITFVLSIFGLFALIPATILEIVILYKVYDQFSDPTVNDKEV